MHKEGLKLSTMAAVVCISSEIGIEDFLIKKCSILKSDIVDLLHEIALANEGRKVSLFMDNLRAHYSREVRQFAETLGWNIIYNAPYSSMFHCIEEVFSIIKRAYKKELIRRDFNLSDSEHFDAIAKSILTPSRDQVMKIEARHLRMMKTYIANKMK